MSNHFIGGLSFEINFSKLLDEVFVMVFQLVGVILETWMTKFMENRKIKCTYDFKRKAKNEFNYPALLFSQFLFEKLNNELENII